MKAKEKLNHLLNTETQEAESIDNIIADMFARLNEQEVQLNKMKVQLNKMEADINNLRAKINELVALNQIAHPWDYPAPGA